MSKPQDLQNLDYFNEHPEELPESQELIDKLLAGESIPTKSSILAGGAADSDMDADPNAKADAGATDEAEAKARAKAEQDAAAAAAAAKDEKEHPQGAPYAVLKGVRERAAAEAKRADDAEALVREATARAAEAEKTAKQLEARVAELDAAAKTGKPAGEEATNLDEVREQIAAMKEDLPAMAGILEKLLGRVESAEAKAAKLMAHRQEDETAEADVVREEVQGTIDRNPSLALWQELHPKVFARACEIDDRLKEDPVWGKKSLSDRFAKVVRDVAEEIPDAPKPKASSDADDKDGTAGKSVQDKIDAALAKAGKKAPVTLSDMKGGEPPGTDVLADVESISTEELSVAFAKMSPAQVEAFLVRHGG